MPRSLETNQRIRDEQRAKILEAARMVFAVKGMAATIDDVAEEARVSHGLAYRYFANKVALFSELVIQDLQSPADWLGQFASEQAAPWELIRRMVTGLVNSRRDYPERYQLLAQAVNDDSAPPDLRERVAARGQALRSVLLGLIEAGQAAGQVARGDPDSLVRAIFATLEGLTARSWVNKEAHRADFPDAEILLRMLKP